MHALSWVNRALFGLTGLTVAFPTQSNGATQYTFDNIQPSDELQWYPCYEYFECARFETPLDHGSSNSPRANVPLIKLPALDSSLQGPYKGMVLLNPGGPGGPGIPEVLQRGTYYRNIIGTNYDVVGFDPRGVGQAYPSANCSNTLIPELSRRGASEDVLRYKLTGPLFDEHYLNESLKEARQVGQHCQGIIGGNDQIGQHMSTVAVATDLKLIVEAFAQTEDGKRAAGNASRLNFWGFSYGTVLGMTFAGQYPESVGHMVLDSNEKPQHYYSGVGNSIYYADDILWSFFRMCSAVGIDDCPFATGDSPMHVYNRFEALIWEFDPKKGHELNWTNATRISKDLDMIHSAIIPCLYDPIEGFPMLARELVKWEQQLAGSRSSDAFIDITSEISLLRARLLQRGASVGAEWHRAIYCSESDIIYGKPLSSLKQYFLNHEKQSILGDSFAEQWALQCLGWPIETAWRYTGPFGGSTSNPIQFVANTFDPVTAIEDAKDLASEWNDAKLITIDGLGHTSTNTENECGIQAITQYFQTGQPVDKFCKFEALPWGILSGWNVTGIDKLERQPQSLSRIEEWRLSDGQQEE